MRYSVIHQTHYDYATPVSRSNHVLHLTPREMPHQQVERHSLLINPAPNEQTEYLDEFGNPTTLITFLSDHTTLDVCARSVIDVHVDARPDPLAGSETIEDQARQRSDSNMNHPMIARYRVASRHTRPNWDIYQYALQSFPADRPIMAGAWELTERIHADITFDPEATDVTTPVAEVLEGRRGVCQDFTHLMLTCLRSVGVPARYVSGYLLTHPPEGQPRLQGADASHAWVSVWTSETGWVDMDPTNVLLPSLEHITISHGRDFDDVSPMSGVLLGGSDHSVDVSVTVEPVAG